ncbi:phosphatase PAP2 family protein [Sphingobacterium sp. SYP-B4668]|uniref:phosphatase PAP2 family protein n=1 Tax=Sphingobacterium sp. SYP-B4668 TaxID=2996035 RepID=UPI0022DDF9A7|nr:phosphatase PAP2 family protein [Sphingobacterium sp. SYP-B4668]
MNPTKTIHLLRYICAFGYLLCCLSMVHAQQAISACQDSSITPVPFLQRIPYKQLVLPVGLMTYGIIALESHFLIGQNQEIRNELQENIDRKFTVDDFSQYASTASVFILDMAGVKAKHNLKQRFFTTAVSHAIMAATVMSVKNTGTVWRPDSSANNSFPSGHTATAFIGAELLWQEYRNQSIWYGIAGYTVAAGTGFFRMYNNKHWLSDVAMGAGIGILSTKIAYWLLPLVDYKFKGKSRDYILLPSYNGRQISLVGSLTF